MVFFGFIWVGFFIGNPAWTAWLAATARKMRTLLPWPVSATRRRSVAGWKLQTPVGPWWDRAASRALRLPLLGRTASERSGTVCEKLKTRLAAQGQQTEGEGRPRPQLSWGGVPNVPLGEGHVTEGACLFLKIKPEQNSHDTVKS